MHVRRWLLWIVNWRGRRSGYRVHVTVATKIRPRSMCSIQANCYARTHIHTQTHTFTHTDKHAHKHTHKHTHKHLTRTRIHTKTRINSRRRSCQSPTQVNVFFTRTHVHTNTHIYTHTHTHTHTIHRAHTHIFNHTPRIHARTHERICMPQTRTHAHNRRLIISVLLLIRFIGIKNLAPKHVLWAN